MDSSSMISHLFDHFGWGDGFLRIHLDTLLVTYSLAAFFGFIVYRWAKKPSLYPESRWETLCYTLVAAADEESQKLRSQNIRIFWGSTLALIFTLIFGANLLSFLPLSFAALLFPFGHFSLVPTADYNFTLALALFSVISVMVLACRQEGIRSFLSKKIRHPFPSPLLFWINLPLTVVDEFIARPLSLSFRLFVNMLIGDVGYLLISAIFPALLQWIPGLIWSSMHVLIVPLQAYIFVCLVSVYGKLEQHEDPHGSDVVHPHLHGKAEGHTNHKA